VGTPEAQPVAARSRPLRLLAWLVKTRPGAHRSACGGFACSCRMFAAYRCIHVDVETGREVLKYAAGDPFVTLMALQPVRLLPPRGALQPA
jgi:hypothetical protein